VTFGQQLPSLNLVPYTLARVENRLFSAHLQMAADVDGPNIPRQLATGHDVIGLDPLTWSYIHFAAPWQQPLPAE
jgi:hypothetical protein